MTLSGPRCHHLYQGVPGQAITPDITVGPPVAWTQDTQELAWRWGQPAWARAYGTGASRPGAGHMALGVPYLHFTLILRSIEQGDAAYGTLELLGNLLR